MRWLLNPYRFAAAGGGGSATLVQWKSGNTTNSVTLDAAPTNGNWLVGISGGSSGGIAASSGWSVAIDDVLNGGFNEIGIFVKKAGASESATQTPSASTSFQWTVVYEFSGLDPDLADLVVGTNGEAFVDNDVSASLNTTPTANCICVAGLIQRASTGLAFTAGIGSTETSTLFGDPNRSGIVGHTLSVTGGVQHTVTVQVTSGTANAGCFAVAYLKLA